MTRSRFRNYLTDYGWFALGMVVFLVGSFAVSVLPSLIGRVGQ